MSMITRIVISLGLLVIAASAFAYVGFPQTTLACHGKLSHEDRDGIDTSQASVSVALRVMRPRWIVRQLLSSNPGWVQLSSISASELIAMTYIESDGGFDITHASMQNSVTNTDLNLALNPIDGSIFVRGRRPNAAFRFEGTCKQADAIF